MRYRASYVMWVVILATLVVAVWSVPVQAHRPYFEEQDIIPDMPWRVEDPTISTAIYATLESATDVDYFTFYGQAGQVVLVSLVIPQIEGQDGFAPTIALMGPELPAAALPPQVARPEGTGALLFVPSPGPAPTFFEPFSRTSYWERQEEHVSLPADGQYTVAVWHPANQVGRYVFVVGEREIPGGDLAFPLKMRGYWTPVGMSSRSTRAWWAVILGTGVSLLVVVALISLWITRRLRHSR